MANRHTQLTGPDRWQISYADLLTLLLGFFIVMYSVSQMETEQKKRVIEALSESFITQPKQRADDIATGSDDSGLPFFNSDGIERDEDADWVYLHVASETLFDSGSAKLMPAAEAELQKMAAWLNESKGAIEVEGHTDNIPIQTEAYPDNWSLSSARAVAIVSYLMQQGVTGARLKAIGFGEFAPIADNGDAEGRASNRRVVIKVERSTLPTNKPKAPLANESLPVEDVAEKVLEVRPQENSDQLTPSVNPDARAEIISRVEDKGLAPTRLPSGGLKFSHDKQR